jgi:hypothetical protein
MNGWPGNIWVFITWLLDREFDDWTVHDRLTCLLKNIKAELFQILWGLAEKRGGASVGMQVETKITNGKCVVTWGGGEWVSG